MNERRFESKIKCDLCEILKYNILPPEQGIIETIFLHKLLLVRKNLVIYGPWIPIFLHKKTKTDFILFGEKTDVYV